jgi:methylmalonyl-CoA/ethylmalonyl-CoA epimerase
MATPRPPAPRRRIVGAKLDHVAFGLASLRDAPETLVGVLGGRTHEGGPNAEFVGGQWEFERGARIEVIVPNDNPTGFMRRFIESRGPGIHHVTFKVPDIYAAQEHALQMGYEITGFNDSYEAWKEMFLHPKSAHGIVVQMAQASPDIPDEGWTRDFPFPTFDGPTPQTADILGLRLNVHRDTSAHRLWGELLGGSSQQSGASIFYRWDASPLRIHVTVDSNTAEGPLAIEVAANRAGALRRSGLQAMGSRFERVD